MKLSLINKKIKPIKVGDIVRYWWNTIPPKWIYIKVVKIVEDRLAGYGVQNPLYCRTDNKIGQWQKIKDCELYETK